MGAVLAAAMLHRVKEIVEAFQRAGATSTAKPVTLASLNLHEGLAVRHLRDRAVLREVTPGSYYLDVPSWEAATRMRHRMAVVMMVVAVVILAGTLLASRS